MGALRCESGQAFSDVPKPRRQFVLQLKLDADFGSPPPL